MLPDITNAIILFGGGLALLLGFAQLLRPARSIKNILLFVIFLCLAIIQLQEFFLSTTPGYTNNAGALLFLLAKFILGPAMYIFYLTVFKKGYIFTGNEFVHFIPLAIASVTVLMLAPSEGYSYSVMDGIYSFLIEHSMLDHLHSLGFALILGYIVSILTRIDVIHVVKDPARDRITAVAVTVMIVLFIIISLIIISLITDRAFYSRAALILISFFVIYWFIIGQIYPDMVIAFARKNRQNERVGALMQGLDINKIETGINNIIVGEKLFCDEDITIKRLAAHLDITPREFSAYLNHHLQVNFNTFINRLRVNESIRIMSEEPDRSLLSIAFAVGFNTKSVFYEAFTKETGLTPARYRKQKILK